MPLDVTHLPCHHTGGYPVMVPSIPCTCHSILPSVLRAACLPCWIRFPVTCITPALLPATTYAGIPPYTFCITSLLPVGSTGQTDYSLHWPVIGTDTFLKDLPAGLGGITTLESCKWDYILPYLCGGQSLLFYTYAFYCVLPACPVSWCVFSATTFLLLLYTNNLALTGFLYNLWEGLPYEFSSVGS